MLRAIIIALLLLCLPALALAEAGMQGRLTVTTDFGGTTLGGLPVEPGDAENESGSEFLQPQVRNGRIFWTDTQMRLELEQQPFPVPGLMGEGAESADEPPMIMVVDYAGSVMYLIDDTTRTALATDLSASQDLASDMGFPLPEAGFLFKGWDQFYQGLDKAENMQLEPLGPKLVNGFECMGHSYVMNLPDVFGDFGSELPDVDPETRQQVMSLFGNMRGEFWVAEGIDFPIQVSFGFLGMKYIWDLLEVQAWQVVPDMLGVPEGYTIEKMKLPEINQPSTPGMAT